MRLSAGKLLEIGFALSILTGPACFAGSSQDNADQTRGPVSLSADLHVAQNAPPVSAPGAAPEQQPDLQPPPPAAAPPPTEAPKPFHGSMSFESGSGKILQLLAPAANIYVADPKVAEVRPASSTSLFVFGVGPGHTTIAAVDLLGRLLADYDITVRPSGFGAREAQAAIARLIPGSNIQVKPSGKGVMLTGPVANASDAAQAVLIAKGFIGGEGANVENQMSIAAPTQVTLMVRIAEMQRSTARNIGLDWSSHGFFGKVAGSPQDLLGFTYGAAATNACGGLVGGVVSAATRGPCFDTVINALASEGLAHILAEPNLTVMSGQSASFMAGGEYPYEVPGGSANPNSVSIDFKPYGVLLSFLPTVLNSGRINLHVKPEVSQLDSTNTVNLPGGGVVDGLLVRRTETTVELGSGETFAIAGMLQTVSNSNDTGLPTLGDAPIIGSLFKSNNMTREQTELVIMVTPVLVRPVRSMAQLKLPGEGYKVPGDTDRLLWQHQVPNADGSPGPKPVNETGFIVR